MPFDVCQSGVWATSSVGWKTPPAQTISCMTNNFEADAKIDASGVVQTRLIELVNVSSGKSKTAWDWQVGVGTSSIKDSAGGYPTVVVSVTGLTLMTNYLLNNYGYTVYNLDCVANWKW
nr:hypothetical protein [Salmonella enterica]